MKYNHTNMVFFSMKIKKVPLLVLGAEEVPCFLEEPNSSSSYSSSSWLPFPALIVLNKGYHWALLNHEKRRELWGKQGYPDGKLRRERRKWNWVRWDFEKGVHQRRRWRWKLVSSGESPPPEREEEGGALACDWSHAYLVSLLHLAINPFFRILTLLS